MTIKKYAGDKITGLSSDTKPTAIPDGATFYETDTGKVFIRASSAWVQTNANTANVATYLGASSNFGNSTGIYSTGVINAVALNTTANVTTNTVAATNVNATNITGNLAGNVSATTISGNLTGNVVATTVNVTTINATSNITVGANILMNTSTLAIGNSSVNIYANTTAFVGNVVATTVTGNLTGNVVATNISGNLTGNVVATNISGNLTGNVVATTVAVSSNITLDNDKRVIFKTKNTAAFVYFVHQNDDNFVFYSTDDTYAGRPVFSIFANSATSALSFSAPVLFNANVNLATSRVIANNSSGTAGQVLTTNGSSTYWSTVTGGGGGSVNVDAQYSWTNIHTFNANVSFAGSGIGLATNTGAIYLGGIGDANWKIGRNTNVTTKWKYTNNTIDIVTANSNLEGMAIGLVGGNTYFETGYLGTFIAGNVTIGNSSSNVSINSVAFVGSLVGNVTGTVFGNVLATTLSGNLTGNVVATTVNATANVTVGTNVLINTTAFVVSNTTSVASHTSSSVTVGNTSITTAPQIVVQNTAGTTTINSNFISTTSISGNLTGNVTGNVVATTLSGNLTGNVTATTISGNLTGNVLATTVNATTINATANIVVGANVLINTSAVALTNTTSVLTYTSTALNVGNTSVTSAPQIVVQNTAGATTINANFISTTSISGNLTGNVTATAITGNLTGNVTATTISGNLTGNVVATTITGNLTGNVSATTITSGAVVVNASGLYVNSATADLYINSSAGIFANSSFGVSGDVLTSNGSAVYWTAPAGGGSVNVNAQYVWTNTHTFQNTITFSSVLNLSTSMTMNTSGIYPASNTVGSELGNTTSRWIILANTIGGTGDWTTTANVGIGGAAQSYTKLYVENSGALDAGRYNQYNYYGDANGTMTAARTKLGFASQISNFNQNKSGDGLTTYDAYYYAAIGEAFSGSSSSSQNAYAYDMTGGRFVMYHYANGAGSNTINNARGIYGQVYLGGTNAGVVNNAYGTISQVYVPSATPTGVVNAAYGVFSGITSNTGYTINNGYLFYGSHQGSTTTNKVGLYITGEANNYISGNTYFGSNVGLGTTGGRNDTRLNMYTNTDVDFTSWGIYNYNNNPNTALTAAPTRYGIQTAIRNLSQNKDVTGVTNYSTNFRAVVADLTNGDSTLQGDARANEMISGNFRIYNYANGATSNTISTAKAAQHQVFSYGSGIISTAYGSVNYIAIGNTTATGNITTAYASYSEVQSNTAATIGTGYLYYGQYTGATTTTKYGLYLTGEANNYLSANLKVNGATYFVGNVGIGVNAQTDTQLQSGITWTSDAGLWNTYIGTTDSNTAMTAARTKLGIHSSLAVQNQNKSADGLTTYSAIYRSILGEVRLGSSSTGGDAYADELQAGRFNVYHYANGANANTAVTTRGVYAYTGHFGSGSIGNAYGIMSWIEIGNTTVTGSIANAFAFNAFIGGNTAGTIGTGYLFKGDYSNANKPTTAYGVYITDEANNYFSGNVTIGGSVNAASYSVGTAFVVNTAQVTIASIPLSANGSTGTSGQVLTSNGATGAPYWKSIPNITVGTSAPGSPAVNDLWVDTN